MREIAREKDKGERQDHLRLREAREPNVPWKRRRRYARVYLSSRDCDEWRLRGQGGDPNLDNLLVLNTILVVARFFIIFETA